MCHGCPTFSSKIAVKHIWQQIACLENIRVQPKYAYDVDVFMNVHLTLSIQQTESSLQFSIWYIKYIFHAFYVLFSIHLVLQEWHHIFLIGSRCIFLISIAGYV